MNQPLINQLVMISPTYTAEVDIAADYKQPEVNAQKVQGYIPTGPARQALISIIQGLMPVSDKRVHLITGQYGAGKSHFGLLLANVLGRLPGDTLLQPFEAKLSASDPKAADELRIRRAALPSRFLVVFVQPTTDPEGFNHSLLVALKEALDRENFPYQLPTRFATAADFIEKWAKDPEMNLRLERELQRQFTDAHRLVLRLRGLDSEAYDIFCRVYRSIVLTDFRPEHYGTPKDVYLEASRHVRREHDMAGIVLVADEFGGYLSSIARDPDGREAREIQDFVQFCKRSREDQVHLVLIAHRTLADYAAGYRSRDEFTKLAGRFIGNEYSLSMAGGQTETIDMIDSVILPRLDSTDRAEMWSRIERALQRWQDWAVNADLFPGKDQTWIRDQLVTGCYPLHPATVFCLPWLSQRVGQANRTTFKFLDSDEPGGLRAFITQAPVEASLGALNLYTPDQLLTYFKNGIEERAEYRPILLARNDALASSPPSSLAKRLVETLAILEIVQQPALPRTRAVLTALASSTSAEAEDVGHMLDLLLQQRVIRFREINGQYELRRRTTGEIDVYEAIQITRDEQARTGNLTVFDLLRVCTELKTVAAHEYENLHGAPRVAAVELVIARHLANLEPYLERIQKWYIPDRASYQGDALILFVLAESLSEIEAARAHLSGGTGSLQLIVAVPRQPFGGGEALFDLAAIERIREQGLKVQGSPVDPDDVKRRAEDREAEIGRQWQQYRSADNFSWYYDRNVNASVPSGGEDAFISAILETVFSKTPRVNDESLVALSGGKRERKADRQKAIKQLLDASGPIVLQKSGGPPNERMLRAALRETELLEKKGDLGQAEVFEVRERAPVGSILEEIWGYMRNQLTSRDPVPLGPMICRLMAPPYGLSTPLTELLVAAALRTITDQVAVFSNVGPTRRGDPRREEIVAENIPNFVKNADDHVSLFYEIDPQQRQYVEELTKLLSSVTGGPSTKGPWDRGKDAMLEWYRRLPAAARDSIDVSQAAWELRQWLSDRRLPDGKPMLTTELPQRLGISTGNVWTRETTQQILDGLRPIVEELQDVAPRRMRIAQEKLCEVFGATGVTLDDLDKAGRAWYNGLSAPQLTHGYSGETKPLMLAIDQVGDPRARLLITLPKALMQSCADTWTSDDQVSLFVERVLRLKQAVESWTPPASVTPPDISRDRPEKPAAPAQVLVSVSGEGRPPIVSPDAPVANPLKAASDKVREALSRLGLTREQQCQVLEALLQELRA